MNRISKKNLNFLYLIFFLILILSLKNYIYCNFFSVCNLGLNQFSGDLSIYFKRYNYPKISLENGFFLFAIFDLFYDKLKFDTFIKIYNYLFYLTIFLCGYKFSENKIFWKFIFFIIIISFYKFYEGYSSFVLKQGLGIIFTLIFIFILNNNKIYLKFLFLMLSVLSHYVFILFYAAYFFSKFFSLKILIIMFILSIITYSLNLNNDLYFYTTNLINKIELFSFDINLLSNLEVNPKFKFVIFSILPLTIFFSKKAKSLFYSNKILFNLLRFHIFYSSLIYFFVSEFYYIDRFISLTWILYPFYLLKLFNIFNFNYNTKFDSNTNKSVSRI